ncbi:hypothetical protein ACQ86N_03700 [Puia sp. P3]|uniref:hypothetical protein n=1 Tax=Puia sp. P3 TaxID=3423952 RepID=UPI003D664877
MNKSTIFFLAATLSCCLTSAQPQTAVNARGSQPITPFQTGDRVVFVGNSITEAGYYESYIWLYYMLHYPGRRITVYNAGIGGDRAKISMPASTTTSSQRSRPSSASPSA